MARKTYTNGEVTVLWDSEKCIHSGICVRGLSEVFNPQARPWINMEGASSDEIVRQVKACPSGAISMKEPEEKNDDMSEITKISVDCLPDGPLKVQGPVAVTLTDGSTQHSDRDVFLCRCGHSQNKPFCDGAHKREGFKG